MQTLFVCDVHIPPSLITALRNKGFEAVHAVQIGLETANDKAIWQYAKDRDAIIITKDSDFVQMSLTGSGPRVILVCLGNCSNRILIGKLLATLPAILDRFDGEARLVELG